MDENHKKEQLAVKLQMLLQRSQDESMTLGEFITSVGVHTQPLLILIFSLPLVVFIILPGISNLFGIVIIFLGVSLTTGKSVWIPEGYQKKKFGGKRLYKILGVVFKVIGWLEKGTRSRLHFILDWPFSRIFHGILLAIAGLCLALPLPPGSSLPPALAAATLSLGILEKDGLWVLIGYFFFVVNSAFFVGLYFFGRKFF